MYGINVSEPKNKKRFFIIYILVAILIFVGEWSHSYKTQIAVEEPMWEESAGTWKCANLRLNKGTYTLKASILTKNDVSWKIVDYACGLDEGVLADGVIPQNSLLLIEEFHVENNSNQIFLVIEDESMQFQVDSAIEIELVKDSYTDWIWLVVIVGVILAIIFYSNSVEIKILSCAAVVLMIPYMNSGLISGHDLKFHLLRIEGIAEGLREGLFPIRINTVFNNGYGNYNSIYYPELFLYLAAILYLCGASIMMSYKILILIINLLTAFVGYYSFEKIFGKRMALIGGILYLMNPYRMVNMYLRAALGELLAMIFLPLLLLGIYELLYRNEKKWWISVVAVSGIIQSHILSLEISFGLVVVVTLISWKQLVGKESKKRWISIIKAIVSVVFVNLWFLLPLLSEMRREISISSRGYTMSSRALIPWQIFLTFFEMKGGNIDNGYISEMPFSIGIVLLICVCIYIYLAYCTGWIEKGEKKLGNVCLLLGIVCCYMATEWFPWKFVEEHSILKFLCILQFPWRTLTFASLFFTVIAVIVMKHLMENKKETVLGILAVLQLLLVVNAIDSTVMDSGMMLESRNQYSPEYINYDYYSKYFDRRVIEEQADNIVVEGADAKVGNYVHEGTEITFELEKNSEDEIVLHFPLYNYGCYQVWVNGEEIVTYSDSNYLLAANVSQGVEEAEVKVTYRVRKLYQFADVVSAIFVLGCVIIYIRKQYHIRTDNEVCKVKKREKN